MGIGEKRAKDYEKGLREGGILSRSVQKLKNIGPTYARHSTPAVLRATTQSTATWNMPARRLPKRVPNVVTRNISLIRVY